MKNYGPSWNELNAYTNAKVVLRRVNGLLAKSPRKRGGDAEREGLLRKTGELAIDVIESIADKNAMDEKSYIGMLDSGNELVDEIAAAGLIQNEKAPGNPPDWKLLKMITCIRALGMRLSDFKLPEDDDDDDGDRKLPEELVRLDTAGRTYDGFKEAAQERPGEYDRRASAGEFAAAYAHSANTVAGAEKSIKENLAMARLTGQTDLLDDAARETACALMHINAGLCRENAAAAAAGDNRKELYLKCAKLIMGAENEAVGGMYGALVSDDPLYSARRLFDAEKEAFRTGKKSPPENISWELDSILGKLGAYERLAAEACSVVRDVAARELIEGSKQDEPDKHMAGCIGKINDIGLEMKASAEILFHNQYGLSRRLYDAIDAAKSGQCATAGDRATDKLAELLALCYACDATALLSDGKKLGRARFDAIYGDMLRIMNEAWLKTGGNLSEIVPQYVAENAGGRET